MLPLLSWNSLSRPGWTETHKDLPAKCWIRGVLHHGPASQTFFTLGGMSSSGALTWPWLMFALMQRRWPEPEYSAAPEREERSFLKSENKAMQPGLELCRSGAESGQRGLEASGKSEVRLAAVLTPFPGPAPSQYRLLQLKGRNLLQQLSTDWLSGLPALQSRPWIGRTTFFYSLGLRGAGGQGGGLGEDGGRFCRCGPPRGRSAATERTAEGPSGENRS